MAGIFTTESVSVLPSDQSSAGSANAFVAQIQAQAPQLQDAAARSVSLLIGQSVTTLQSQIDSITSALRENLPFPETIAITDPTGNLIAWLGYQVVGNVNYEGIWANSAYFGGTGPANAPIVITSTGVTLTDVSLIVTDGATTVSITPTSDGITVVTGPFEVWINPAGIQLSDSSTNQQTSLIQGEILMQNSSFVQTVTITDAGTLVLVPSSTVTVSLGLTGISVGDSSLGVKSLVQPNEVIVEQTIGSGIAALTCATGAPGGGLALTDGSGSNTIRLGFASGLPQLLTDGQQVVTNRQSGPGSPSGISTLVALVGWCTGLYDSLSAAGGGHGLIN